MNLSQLIVEAVTHLGGNAFRMLAATAGSTTTLADTVNLAGDMNYTDDDSSVVGGTIIVTQDTAGLAPQDEISTITAYLESASQFTFGALTAAVAAGDNAMFISSLFPYIVLKRLANSMLADLGHIALIDTSITTASNVYEYALPVGLKYSDPIRVAYADNDANERIPVSRYHVIPAAPGTAGKLVLRDLPIGRQVYVTYNGAHPALTAFSSLVSETIDPALAAWALAASIWRWKSPAQSEINRANEAFVKADQFKMERPVSKPQKQTKWFESGLSGS